MWSCLHTHMTPRRAQMHANARLTPIGRLTMVMRIESGRTLSLHAESHPCNRHTLAPHWVRRNERRSQIMKMFEIEVEVGDRLEIGGLSVFPLTSVEKDGPAFLT